MKKLSRKRFLSQSMMAMGSAAILGACSLNEGENTPAISMVDSKKTYRWRMVTTWPPNFPILGEGCQFFADWVDQASGGRLKIKVYGGGELIPALEAFDAVSSGTAEIGSGTPYYWAGKASATQFFSTVPFGMNAQMMNTWLLNGGGYQLWKDLYHDFNLIPFSSGNTGVQMGGWFNRPIETVEDFMGLKMRMPGLGGKVLEKMGGSAVLLAGGEIYTGLERGVIDATEWIGPYHDYKMGFHKIAKYYYAPGWHEPGTNMEMFFNRQKFEALPKDLQMILEMGTQKMNTWTLASFESMNAIYLSKIKSENTVQLRSFSPEILDALHRKTNEVLSDICSSDPMSNRIFQSYQKFMKDQKPWSEITEKKYYNLFI